ncbi:MAG: SDR family oxidoreductase [Sedimentisphaerales bacterium]|nr:SDR family oxidoreductase [Sedimentisphaerales bacterium]
MVNLKDKVVIVTGASSGIGRATAKAFAHKGSKVVLAARRVERLQKLREEISVVNPNCIFVQTDVTREEDVLRLFNETESHFGQVDILINNAGCGLKSEISDIDMEHWSSVLATNLDSVFLCSREAIRHMKTKQVKGHILTVCSVAGLYGGPTYAAYCASKHGVAGFMRSLKWEVRKYGIKAGTIYPARVNTEFFADYKVKPKAHEMLSAEDIARYLVALATRCPLQVIRVRLYNLWKRVISLLRFR